MSLFARDAEPIDMDRDESCFVPRLLLSLDKWAMTSMRVFLSGRWEGSWERE